MHELIIILKRLKAQFPSYHERLSLIYQHRNSNISNLIFQTMVCGKNIAHIAARSGNTDILDWLSQHKDARVKNILLATTSDGFNIAHMASKNGQIDTLKWMDQHPAEISNLLLTTTDDGFNIAHIASEHNHFDTLVWIDQHPRAEIKNLLLATTNDGFNIAHIAAHNGYLEMLEWLYDNEYTLALLIKPTVNEGYNIAHIAVMKYADGDSYSHILTWIFVHIRCLFHEYDFKSNDLMALAEKSHTLDALTLWLKKHGFIAVKTHKHNLFADNSHLMEQSPQETSPPNLMDGS